MSETTQPEGDGKFEARLERPKRAKRPGTRPAPARKKEPGGEVKIPTRATEDWPESPNLNPRQQLFAEYYMGVSNFNATDAARRAGYSMPYAAGYRLSKNVHVLSRVRERMAGAQMDADEVMARLTNIGRLNVEHCLEEVTDSKGVVKVVKANRAEILRALEIIAKRHGLLADRMKVGIDGMTPEEMRHAVVERLLARGAETVATLLGGKE